MGGGDLNLKKEWHTQKMVNIEKVWLAEQKRAKEEQMVQQLRKERQEERERQELVRMQEEAGLIKKRAERVEWMYNNANNEEIVNEEREAYLLGKKKIGQDSFKSIGSYVEDKQETYKNGFQPFTGITPENEQRVFQAKMREDPMFAIKIQEKAHLEKLAAEKTKRKEVKKEAKSKTERESNGHYRRRSRSPAPVSRRDTDKASVTGHHYRRYRERSRSPPGQHYRERSTSPPPRKSRYEDTNGKRHAWSPVDRKR
jgi:hypothetical protein